MIELLGGAVGGIVGGALRLAPEVIKFFDRRNDRAHELEMLKVTVEVEKTRGEFRLQEIGAQHAAAVDIGVLDAYRDAIKQQADMVQSAGGIAATFSALVRPLVTYALVGIYLLIQLLMAGEILIRGGNIEAVYKFVMTADFVALVAGVMAYWFVERSIQKGRV